MTTNAEVQLLPPGGTVAREVSEDAPIVETHGFSQAESPVVQLREVYRKVADRGAVLGPVVCNNIQIGSLLDQRLRMRLPLTINIKREDQFYVATCEGLSERGYGTDPIIAVQDMRKNIANLYWRLKEDQSRLGQDLVTAWQKLSGIVYEI